jgi:tubulin monoglycylase TTLL3/8
MHLTNATINKDNLNKNDVKSEGQYEILNNMWETDNFNQFLKNEF